MSKTGLERVLLGAPRGTGGALVGSRQMSSTVRPTHRTSWRGEEEARRYELGRPSYPESAVQVMVDELRLGPGSHLIDVGAGTGKLTRVLTRTGAEVTAVEPMPGMQAELRRRVQGATVVSGIAEELPIESGAVDAIAVGQAFHWFDVARAGSEFHRALRAGGRLAIVNNRRHEAAPWVKELWTVLAGYESLAPPPLSTHSWRKVLESTDLFGSFDRFVLRNEQRFASMEQFDARFTSISFAIMLSEQERRAMILDLHRVVEDVDPLVLPLQTVIEVATRRG